MRNKGLHYFLLLLVFSCLPSCEQKSGYSHESETLATLGSCTLRVKKGIVSVNGHCLPIETKDLLHQDKVLISGLDKIEVSGDSRWAIVAHRVDKDQTVELQIVDLSGGRIHRTFPIRHHSRFGDWDASGLRLPFSVYDSARPLTARVDMLDCTKPEVELRTVYRESGGDASLRPDMWRPDDPFTLKSKIWSPGGQSIAFVVEFQGPPRRYRLVSVELTEPPVARDLEEIPDPEGAFVWRIEWQKGLPSVRVAGPGDY